MGRHFKTVVTSSAGYPLDKTFYQTIKGMVTPLDILEPGGTLIIASECSEGFGSHEFREAQARLVELGPERFLATLTAKSLAEIDEWQTEMQLKAMRVGRTACVLEARSSHQPSVGLHAHAIDVATLGALRLQPRRDLLDDRELARVVAVEAQLRRVDHLRQRRRAPPTACPSMRATMPSSAHRGVQRVVEAVPLVGEEDVAGHLAGERRSRSRPSSP